MTGAQLQRIPYVSAVDQTEREFFLYLPAGYETEAAYRWFLQYKRTTRSVS